MKTKTIMVMLLLAGAANAQRQALDRSLWPFCRVAVGDYRGSGTLVDVNDQFGLVITNNHVVRDGGLIRCRFLNGESYQGELISANGPEDLAAIKIRKPVGIRPIALASFSGAQQIYTINGFGRGLFLQQSGELCAIDQRPNGAQYDCVRLACYARSGDSGGAVMDQAGKMVGVLWGCASDGTYATCGKPLTSFLSRLTRCEGGQCWRPSAGFSPGGRVVFDSPQQPKASPVETAPQQIENAKTDKAIEVLQARLEALQLAIDRMDVSPQLAQIEAELAELAPLKNRRVVLISEDGSVSADAVYKPDEPIAIRSVYKARQ